MIALPSGPRSRDGGDASTWVIGFANTGGESGAPNPVESVASKIRGPAQFTLKDSDP